MDNDQLDLDPNEAIEFDYDPETDTDEDPELDTDHPYEFEEVEGAEPVSDDVADVDIPVVEDEEEGE